ncbi:MAG: hypothetical protein KDE53_29450 [Caldilineaceae bacterium]|mgnify:CR=1 FL=1|nr:hypothetical protein [Caldilineaceae bacterium]HRW09549.1 proton-conducting transporter membrane subunit [Caldilineaceae bacterium]
MSLNPNWLVAPIVLPLIAAALGLVFSRWGYRQGAQIQRLIALLAVTGNLLVALLLLSVTIGQNERVVYQMGLWPAPYGITIVADGLSAIMLTLTAILAAAIVPYAMGTLDQRERMNFYPLLLFLLMGVNGAFLSGDLFNLYVFFEVLLMASFVLLTLGGQQAQINSGIRYVVLNLMASIIFLSAAGLAYGTMGTLNMAHLAQRIDKVPPAIGALLAGLLLIAYSSKAGLFPLFFWLPASYHTPHPAITAFFGGLLTKVGIYTLFRIFPLIFPTYLVAWQPLILTIAGFTMLTGVFGAMSVGTLRRVLSFHVISQVGYMVMGLGLAATGNPVLASFAMAAGILYLVHHMIVKTALLMAGGAAELEMGSGILASNQLNGLVGRRPLLAVIFFVAAFSLAGIPPSSGFISKLGLLQSALTGSHWWIAAVSLVVSVLTLMSMVRLWQNAFTGHATQPIYPTAPLTNRERRWLTLGPIAVLVLLSLSIGLFSGPVFQWSTVAATQVLDRAGYIADVAPTDVIEMVTHE